MSEEQTTARASIEELLVRARGGEKRALELVCDRSKVLLLAASLRSGLPWRESVASVPENLKFFCRKVLDGELEPTNWREQIVELAETAAKLSAAPRESGEGLTGMRAIPRFARRRVIREAAVSLPLPQLVALLLKHVEGATPAEMVGTAADSEDEATDLLAAANQTLVNALEEANLAEEEES